MDQPVMRYSLSSGRRPLPNRSGCYVTAGILAVIALVAVLELTRGGTPPPAAASPTPTVAPPATPAPSATPPRPEEHASDWVTAVAPTTTPTPWLPAAPAAPRRRGPSPTPSAASCLSATYEAEQSLASWGNVLITVRATNRCRRVLQPTDVMFRVSGFRDGDLIQTAQGSPFEEIWPGRSTDFGIGLPGSLDWYDRITVEIIDSKR
ncbi:MAG TPA: hypothetical protein PKJ99_16070 [Thermoanaerobaculales bacterium]|nr:hypothetical protein [Thermoanaerobaculales bacterium]HPA81732.1 hypothetical protein [Thermoanaerobaculales bacterium]HQL29991.1 hypothetical protein [Thermoanaerobaculales bacterium]HQN96832.1 hypothetical protein [Thermoanaerobaculales bacterium]